MPAADAWAVIACTSTSWHNYRHVSNALAVYHAARNMGIPDERIVLMLAGSSVPCDARNSAPGRMFHSAARSVDLYPPDIQVDYRGSSVTVDTFLRVLTDRLPDGTPSFRRLRSGANSTLLIYLAGHGGEGFLKFRDQAELTSRELADGLAQMRAQRRYGELLLLLDTWQAATMTEHFDASRLEQILSLSASGLGENSYSLETDNVLGVAVSDRFTFHLHRFLVPHGERGGPASLGGARDASLGGAQATRARGLSIWLRELEGKLRRSRLMSTPVRGAYGWRGDAELATIERFFGASTPPRLVVSPAAESPTGSASWRGSGRVGGAVDPAARRDAEELAFWGTRLPQAPSVEPAMSGGGKAAVLLLPMLQAVLLWCVLHRWPRLKREFERGTRERGLLRPRGKQP